jgi:hypothetical protein
VPEGFVLYDGAMSFSSLLRSIGQRVAALRQQPLLHWLLPPGALFLLLLLLGLLPFVLCGLKALLMPLLLQSPALLKGDELALPIVFYIKVGAFLALSGLALAQLGFRLTVIYTTAWSQYYPRPHALHVEFQPDFRYSFLALLQWYGYCLLRLIIPTLAGMALFALVLWLELFGFNLLMDTPLIGWPIFFIIGLFIVMMLALLIVLLMVNSAKGLLTATYGTCAVITEPLRSPAVLFARCSRLTAYSPLVWGVWLLKVLLGLALLSATAWLLLSVNLQQLLAFNAPWLTIVVLEVALWLAWVLLGAYQFMAYYKALQTYYASLPASVIQRFSPPLASGSFPVAKA